MPFSEIKKSDPSSFEKYQIQQNDSYPESGYKFLIGTLCKTGSLISHICQYALSPATGNAAQALKGIGADLRALNSPWAESISIITTSHEQVERTEKKRIPAPTITQTLSKKLGCGKTFIGNHTKLLAIAGMLAAIAFTYYSLGDFSSQARIQTSVRDSKIIELTDLVNSNIEAATHQGGGCPPSWSGTDNLIITSQDPSGLTIQVQSPSTHYLCLSLPDLLKQVPPCYRQKIVRLKSSDVKYCSLSTEAIAHVANNLAKATADGKKLPSNALITQAIDAYKDRHPILMPPEIGEFTNLKELVLSGGGIDGGISKKICQLKQLEILDLSNNNLKGVIPNCIGQFKKLKIFNFQGNALGVLNDSKENLIPDFSRSNLEILKLGFNSLGWKTANRSIPKTFCQIERLKELHLQANDFEGFIPNCFDQLKQVEVLDVGHNRLKGPIPDQGVLMKKI